VAGSRSGWGACVVGWLACGLCLVRWWHVPHHHIIITITTQQCVRVLHFVVYMFRRTFCLLGSRHQVACAWARACVWHPRGDSLQVRKKADDACCLTLKKAVLHSQTFTGLKVKSVVDGCTIATIAPLHHCTIAPSLPSPVRLCEPWSTINNPLS
jgi:hypothetical protein